MKRFGIVLAEILEAKGISQSELARMCGVSRQSINRIIAGHVKDPSLPVAFRICDSLDIDINDVKRMMEEG